MIPNRDYYADNDGKLTDDPNQYARQIGVRGCLLDERIARRYGITDTLVATGEPHAVRRVTGRSESSVQIHRAEEEETTQEPQEPAEVAEPESESQEAEDEAPEQPKKEKKRK